ncbi:MAG: bifunctional oligoribonuclease/PAP phosphatase NrnA [Spirochaetaceae bacterium]|nr:MAG: bifunctional oligoribonuclease/PAP phosphatase NrnA [Spirochaetaceae bacterium]
MPNQAVIDFIERYEKFIITAHETPDGDALGSEYAMLLALRKMGKDARILNADPAPKKFAFVAPDGEFEVLVRKEQIPADIAEFGLFVLDVNDINNIGQVATLILPRVKEYFIVDHHDSETVQLSENHIEQNASSTCEILYQLFREMELEIDLPMARALYMGILYDTGSFIYPKTTALTFDIAHNLVSLGVRPNETYVNVYESNSISSLVLMSKVLATLELFYNDQVAVQTMTQDLIRTAGASYEESDQLINIPLRSANVRVSIFFKENLEGVRRCSLRSKGHIDVASIAQSLGGGGHKTAAGFKCVRPFEVMKVEVLEMLHHYFNDQKHSVE